MKILVLGDSTAVGTGAKDPKNTTAGRLSSLFPNAALLNISRNGMKMAELNKKMDDITGRYDYILIQIGANDIIQFTSKEDMENTLNQIILKAKKLSNRVVILHSGDIGKSKFFSWYIQPIYSYRTQNVRKIYMRQAEMHTIQYVDLFTIDIPDYYYAADKLHLNDEGYGGWFDEIKKKIDPSI
jgi:lysophospholipase L1-like esterase